MVPHLSLREFHKKKKTLAFGKKREQEYQRTRKQITYDKTSGFRLAMDMEYGLSSFKNKFFIFITQSPLLIIP